MPWFTTWKNPTPWNRDWRTIDAHASSDSRKSTTGMFVAERVEGVAVLT
jgi:hypothetical protein